MSKETPAGELLPCPFCGCAPEAYWRRANPKAMCRTEGCMGAKLPILNLDQPDAIAAWNHRAADRTQREGDVGMPELPEPTWAMPASMAGKWEVPGAFTAAQMREYAQAALAALKADHAVAAPQPTALASRDAESLREIRRVSSCLAESWPDLETDTMIVRHFKWMARYINATPPRTDVLKAVDELLTVSATAFGTGVDDPHRHYQDQLKALRSARADDLARHPPAAPDPSFQLCGECGHRGLPSRIGECRRCGWDALELITAPASKAVQP